VKIVTSEGKTVEEAIAAGLKMLGRPRDQVQVRVLEEPGRRLFGWFGRRTAKVELVWQPDPIYEVRHFLQDVIRWMGVSAAVQVEEMDEGQRLRIQLFGEQLGPYIGRRGETLQALQYLAGDTDTSSFSRKRAAMAEQHFHFFFAVDCVIVT